MDIRAGKGVRRIILLQRDDSGSLMPKDIYRKRRSKKKKGTVGLREMERATRVLGKAQQAFTDTLMNRHKRSNRKAKDGWLRDIGPNVFKASKKGWRELTKGMGM